MLYKKYKPNTRGIDYVVGDIHGCYKTFCGALDRINFRISKDRMFSVGDLVDRGSHSLTCLDLLDCKWFHMIRGNHEQMAIDYMDHINEFDYRHFGQTYSANGGDWFLDLHPELQKKVADRFRKLPITIQIGDVALCHADPYRLRYDDLLLDLKSNSKQFIDYISEQVIWKRGLVRSENPVYIEGVNHMFFGHTVQQIKPKQLGNMYFIDTGCVFGNTLTVYKLDGSSYIQEPCIDGRYVSKYFR